MVVIRGIEVMCLVTVAALICRSGAFMGLAMVVLILDTGNLLVEVVVAFLIRMSIRDRLS